MATEYFSRFADAGFARDAGAVGGGVMTAQAAEIALDGTEVMGFDLPAEAGGAATIVAAEVVPGLKGKTKRHYQLGGAVALFLAVFDRLGIHDAVMGVFE